MTKKRIFILITTFVLVAAMVLAVLFLPRSSTLVYNDLTALIEYENRMATTLKLQSLQQKGYGDNYEKEFLTSHIQITNLRKKIVGYAGDYKVAFDNYAFYSYNTLNQSLTSSLEIYTINTNISNQVPRTIQREITKLINLLRKDIALINQSITKVLDNQSSNLETPNEEQLLFNSYQNLQNHCRSLLATKSQLVLKVKELVVKYSFNNNFLDSTSTALSDCFTYSTRAAMKVSPLSENSYLHDSSLALDKIHDYQIGRNIFSKGISEREFLFGFRDLYYDYNDGLIQIFDLPHSVKQNVINDNNFTSSNIKADYYEQVRRVLVIVGI